MDPSLTLRFSGNGVDHTYQVEREKTVIEHAGSQITVDYGKSLVENRELVSNRTKRYPIELSLPSVTDVKGKETGMEHQVVQIFGSYETQELPPAADAEEYRRMRIVWGSKVDKFRSIGVPYIERFGMQFGVETYVCLVDDYFEYRDILERICTTREPYFMNNPLLRRIDFCGLYSVLAGLPVKIETEGVGQMVLVDVDLK